MKHRITQDAVSGTSHFFQIAPASDVFFVIRSFPFLLLLRWAMFLRVPTSPLSSSIVPSRFHHFCEFFCHVWIIPILFYTVSLSISVPCQFSFPGLVLFKELRKRCPHRFNARSLPSSIHMCVVYSYMYCHMAVVSSFDCAGQPPIQRPRRNQMCCRRPSRTHSGAHALSISKN
jgi:hypothetical protein